MSDFEDNVKNLEETQYREVRQTLRTARDKMRALRDEFGFKQPPPQIKDNSEVSEE